MTQVQYAVCHLQRGSGSDAGMSCHIERKDGKGKPYIPENADKSCTHLNRELIIFPSGVKNRTDAINYRIAHAGLHRKVGKNQTKAVRIILTGTHEQMMKLERQGKLNDWMKANLNWLNKTYGQENVVSCVLRMDEKAPHLHATVVPIVTTPRKRKAREGEKKNKVQTGSRLSCDDVMARGALFNYQNTYDAAMKHFGLERGIVGSTAKHKDNSTYYKEQMATMEADIAQLQEEVEKTKEGRSTFFAFFGKGDLAKAKSEISAKDREIARLEAEIEKLKEEKVALQKAHKQKLIEQHNGYQKEIDAAIKHAQQVELKSKQKDSVITRRKPRLTNLIA